AGRRAQRKWANPEAAQFYERALEWAKNVPGLEPAEIAEVWESLADCLILIGRYDRAAEAFEAARELVPNRSVKQIRLVAKEGLLREEMGRYEEAIRWYSRGLRAVSHLPKGEEQDTLKLELSMYHAHARYREGDFQDCLRRCDEVLKLALDLDDRDQLANVYLLLHILHTQIGSPDR